MRAFRGLGWKLAQGNLGRWPKTPFYGLSTPGTEPGTLCLQPSPIQSEQLPLEGVITDLQTKVQIKQKLYPNIYKASSHWQQTLLFPQHAKAKTIPLGLCFRGMGTFPLFRGCTNGQCWHNAQYSYIAAWGRSVAAVQVRQEIRCQHQHKSAQEHNNTLVTWIKEKTGHTKHLLWHFLLY